MNDRAESNMLNGGRFVELGLLGIPKITPQSKKIILEFTQKFSSKEKPKDWS